MARAIVQSLPDYSLAHLLTVDGHALVSDEPDTEGGNGLGPSPYDLLLWALGACTAMTLQIYARRKGYPLLEVAVEVEHDRVHIEDCSDCDNTEDTGLIEVMRRKIVLRGELSEAQRADLLRVAAKCPVHKTIRAMPQVLDTLEVVD